MTEKNNIGKPLHYDETGFDRTLNAYKRLVALVNEIAQDYETYKLGSFSKDVYEDILQNGIKNIKKQYKDNVRLSIEKLGIVSPTIKENLIAQAVTDMNAYEAKINDLFNVAYGISGSPMYSNYPIHLEQIHIINHRAEIDQPMLEWLKKHFTSVIETENQSKFYEMFIKLKNSYDRCADFLNETNKKCDMLSLSPANDDLFYVDDAGHLQLAGQNIAQIS